TLKVISPVSVEPVTNDKERHLWNEYIERYHPLGYKHPFDYAIRYFIRANGQYLGCIMLYGASRALAPRDRWIGWQPKQRKANLSWIVNNSRYLSGLGHPSFNIKRWVA
ncbi:Druantia anti-phage system protein DruA, partial [sulfur-oxidizing endosymbiont of Gigantopelta aegis]